MGCCKSKPLEFAPISLAEGIIPPSSPDPDVSFGTVKVIPAKGLISRAMAIYLENDRDGCPSYYFKNEMEGCRVYKASYFETGEMLQSEDLCIVQTGKRDRPERVTPQLLHSSLPERKTIEIVTKTDGKMVTMWKALATFTWEGHVIGLDGGYSLEKKSDTCTALLYNGNAIAYIYDVAGPPKAYTDLFTGRKAYMDYVRKPLGIHVSKSLSEVEMIRAVTILTSANDRMIPEAQREASHTGGGVGGGM